MSLRSRLKCILFVNTIFICLFNNQVKSVNSKSKAYLIENAKFLSWNDALDYCKKLNMSLFSIENANEFDYLKTILKTKHEVIFPYWLGAYKTNDSFKWISTGKNIEEFFWHSGEPNNKSGNENCIHTWEELFDWNDNDCERELPFICELEE